MKTKLSQKVTEYYCEKYTAKYLGLSPRTLQCWRLQGTGPNYIKMGRSVRYSLSDCKEFIFKNRIKPRKRHGIGR